MARSMVGLRGELRAAKSVVRSAAWTDGCSVASWVESRAARMAVLKDVMMAASLVAH